MGDLVVLYRFLRATSKKGHQLFEEKSSPPDKILATPMSGNDWDWRGGLRSTIVLVFRSCAQNLICVMRRWKSLRIRSAEARRLSSVDIQQYWRLTAVISGLWWPRRLTSVDIQQYWRLMAAISGLWWPVAVQCRGRLWIRGGPSTLVLGWVSTSSCWPRVSNHGYKH